MGFRPNVKTSLKTSLTVNSITLECGPILQVAIPAAFPLFWLLFLAILLDLFYFFCPTRRKKRGRHRLERVKYVYILDTSLVVFERNDSVTLMVSLRWCLFALRRYTSASQKLVGLLHLQDMVLIVDLNSCHMVRYVSRRAARFLVDWPHTPQIAFKLWLLKFLILSRVLRC